MPKRIMNNANDIIPIYRIFAPIFATTTTTTTNNAITMGGNSHKKSKMSTEDMKFQGLVCSKYRELDIIPTMQKVRQETGVSLTTISTFMSGNSANKAIRAYFRLRFEKNLTPIPEDIAKLLAIWDGDINQD